MVEKHQTHGRRIPQQHQMSRPWMLRSRCNTVVSFCNPALLSLTLDQLTNREYVKLCVATARSASRWGNGFDICWCALQTLHQSNWPLCFQNNLPPTHFCSTNGERQSAYTSLLRSLVSCSNKFADLDLVEKPRQVVRQHRSSHEA